MELKEIIYAELIKLVLSQQITFDWSERLAEKVKAAGYRLTPELTAINEQEIGKILNDLANEQLNLPLYKSLSKIQIKWLAGERIRDAQLQHDRSTIQEQKK